MEIGKERILLKSIDSTNTHALQLAEKGYPHGTVVVADSQTKGRGRHGRIWYSPEGDNIYMSIILKPPVAKGRKGLGMLSLLTIMSAVAVSEAIEKETSILVKVKWPNDIMVSDGRGFKKVGGILSEARFLGTELEFAIVGIGINVGPFENIPPEIMDSATTISVAAGKDIDSNDLLEGILRSFDNWYGFLLRGHRKEILKRWRELSLTLGQEVMAIAGERIIRGVAIDIDDYGRLELRLSSGKIKRIDSSDIVHLR